LPDSWIHSIFRDRLDGNLRRPLEVIGGTGRDVAIEDQSLRSSASHQHGNPVLQLAHRKQKAILGRPLQWLVTSYNMVDTIPFSEFGSSMATPAIKINPIATACLRGDGSGSISFPSQIETTEP
jgi:hypothetical protein